MSRGPVASQLCLLSTLPDRRVGDKVRFLGCVTSYCLASACLTLGHLHPHGTNVTVLVDVNLALETLSSEQTRVGEYVNVLGYIAEKSKNDGKQVSVTVQALLLWPTGPMDIQRYERTFETGTTKSHTET